MLGVVIAVTETGYIKLKLLIINNLVSGFIVRSSSVWL